MIEDENLRYFITEDLYMVEEDAVKTKQTPSVQTPTSSEPTADQVADSPAPYIANPAASSPLSTLKTPSISVTPQVTYDTVVMVLPMNSKDKELLNNLMKAIQKSPKDVHLLDSFSSLNVGYKRLLSFGYLNELKYKLGLPLENYTIYKHGESQILLSSPLSALHDNKAEKSALWKCLQEMFL